MIIGSHLHMPSYFLMTFTEYPFLGCFLCVIYYRDFYISNKKADLFKLSAFLIKDINLLIFRCRYDNFCRFFCFEQLDSGRK